MKHREHLREILHDGEPCFVILGRDRHAVSAVTSYALDLALQGNHAGAAECREIAQRMAAWQRENLDQVKEPD